MKLNLNDLTKVELIKLIESQISLTEQDIVLVRWDSQETSRFYRRTQLHQI